MKRKGVLVRGVALVTAIAFLLAACATNISIVSYYPPGNNMYEPSGKLFISVDTSDAGEGEGSQRRLAKGNVIEQYGSSVFYIEDPGVQSVNDYIRAAFALDYARSNAFEIVGSVSKADYLLEVKVDKHFGIITVNPLRLMAAALLTTPTLGLSLLLFKVYKIKVENIATVTLSRINGKELYSRDFTESFEKKYPLTEAGYYNTSYLRVGLLKKIVTQSLDDIAEVY